MPDVYDFDPEAQELEKLKAALTTGRGWFISDQTYRREQHAKDAAEPFGMFDPAAVKFGDGWHICFLAGPRPLSVQRFLDRLCAVHGKHSFHLTVSDADEQGGVDD